MSGAKIVAPPFSFLSKILFKEQIAGFMIHVQSILTMFLPLLHFKGAGRRQREYKKGEKKKCDK